jgi:hypothetical protein
LYMVERVIALPNNPVLCDPHKFLMVSGAASGLILPSRATGS